jgi:tetratricopeptide (TPR) repeat protein
MKFATFIPQIRKPGILIKGVSGFLMIKFLSSLISLTIIGLIALAGCSEGQPRKIKLAGTDNVIKTANLAGTTVLQVSPEDQKSVVIRYFRNNTGETSLDWMERGLTDMLITELSQSPYLNIISESQFLDAAYNMGKKDQDLGDRLVEVLVAGRMNANILLTGGISKSNNTVSIQVEVTDANTGGEIRKERVDGEGLEKIFSMVDELSQRLRKILREKGDSQQYASINLSEMTHSLDAFRCYSKALENREKFLFVAAEECLEEALEFDSTFAAAYVQLVSVRASLKKPLDYAKMIDKMKRYSHKLSYADKVKLELIESEMKHETFKMISILENAIKRDPTNIELRFPLAQRYRIHGFEEKALHENEQILEIDPNFKMAYNELGYLFADMGDFKTALYMLDKYQKLAPDEPNPHDSKGEILMFAGKMPEAAEEYKQALQIMPGYYSSAFKLSEIYTEKGDQKKALKYLEYGLNYVSDTGFETNADFNRARIYWRFGEIEKANKYFSNLLDKYPLNSHVHLRRIEMYRSAGQKEYANDLELQVIKAFKKDIENSSGPYKLADEYFYFIGNSQIPFENIIQSVEDIVSQYKKSDKNLSMEYARDFCDLYLGRSTTVKNSFREKIPILLKMFDENRNEIGWGSTWKTMFLFFNGENSGPELSDIFTEGLSNYAMEKGRKDLEFIANMAQARVFGRDDKVNQYASLYKKYGVPVENTWSICGPFREYNLSGFEHVFPPENEIKMKLNG